MIWLQELNIASLSEGSVPVYIQFTGNSTNVSYFIFLQFL